MFEASVKGASQSRQTSRPIVAIVPKVAFVTRRQRSRDRPRLAEGCCRQVEVVGGDRIRDRVSRAADRALAQRRSKCATHAQLEDAYRAGIAWRTSTRPLRAATSCASPASARLSALADDIADRDPSVHSGRVY